MISDEKMIHILHLMLDGIWKADFVDYPNEDEAVKEAKRTCMKTLSHFSAAEDIARKRISSQKNPPPENSPQWETLYKKYYEEEWQKKGG